MTEGGFPSLTPREVVRALERGGFVRVRQRGSHVIMRHPETGRSAPVAMHSGDVARETVQRIIRQAGLTREEFLKLL